MEKYIDKIFTCDKCHINIMLTKDNFYDYCEICNKCGQLLCNCLYNGGSVIFISDTVCPNCKKDEDVDEDPYGIYTHYELISNLIINDDFLEKNEWVNNYDYNNIIDDLLVWITWQKYEEIFDDDKDKFTYFNRDLKINKMYSLMDRVRTKWNSDMFSEKYSVNEHIYEPIILLGSIQNKSFVALLRDISVNKCASCDCIFSANIDGYLYSNINNLLLNMDSLDLEECFPNCCVKKNLKN